MKFIVCCLYLLLLYSCQYAQPSPNQQQSFVPFYPTYKNKNHEYTIQKEYSPLMHKNILQVLDYYKVSYKIEGDLILIPQSEYNNRELMRNYTNKSMNQQWLQEHQVE